MVLTLAFQRIELGIIRIGSQRCIHYAIMQKQNKNYINTIEYFHLIAIIKLQFYNVHYLRVRKYFCKTGMVSDNIFSP